MKGDRIFVGLDPSAGPLKPSGICVLDIHRTVLFLGKWRNFTDIMESLSPLKNHIVAVGVDGPLQPPHELGRCCFSDSAHPCSHQQTSAYQGRWCEHLLIKKGFRCFVTSKKSFARNWMARCFELNEFLTSQGLRTLEVYPTAARQILFPGLEGKKQSLDFRQRLQTRLKEWGIHFPVRTASFSHDELDAVLAAVTIMLNDEGRAEAVGDARDGFILLPLGPGQGLPLSAPR